MISLLNISDSVEICITDKFLNKHFYKTKIADLFDDDTADYIVTMVPTSDSGTPIIFFKDVPYQLYAKFEEGIIVWQISYFEARRNGGLLECVFKVASTPEITQRREYFRQAVAIPYTFKKFSNPENLSFDPATSEEYEGHIIDISGGGCAFFANEFLNIGSIVDGSFMFKTTAFRFFAHVLDRAEFSRASSKYEFKYRVNWVNPPNRDIDVLVRLVFEQQRDNIAKERFSQESFEQRRARLWE
ncbi:MAG: flagellar brake protein [Eubacteriales bacterium]